MTRKLGKRAHLKLHFDLHVRSVAGAQRTGRRAHSQDNCRFVLFGVNALRGRGTDDDMLLIAQAVADALRAKAAA